jgi:hypothetical protein
MYIRLCLAGSITYFRVIKTVAIIARENEPKPMTNNGHAFERPVEKKIENYLIKIIFRDQIDQ